jgi:leucyl/phenylalanyl-tRNA--protein transferase
LRYWKTSNLPSTPGGPDPNFPYLDENERFQFPLPEKSSYNSIIAWGANLSPGMLLSAYEQGLFPWYGEGEPLLWHSPDPRFVIFPEKLHVSASMKKIMKKEVFEITLDKDFEGVIRGCAEIDRPGQGGTWINSDVIPAYIRLHELGWAHSAEARLKGRESLAGGCYGIRLGNVFFGESMFSLVPNASKAAFLYLAQRLFEDGLAFIDCQIHTPHLESLGGEKISRKKFLNLLRKTLSPRLMGNKDILDRRGNWSALFYSINSK